MNIPRFLLLFASFSFLFINATETKKIKMYTYCTPSHEILRDNWFLPSIKDDYEIIVKYNAQECAKAEYKEPGWHETMLSRANIILEAIEDNWDDFFIFSDLDIQFFQPTKDIIMRHIASHDIVFQRIANYPGACPGFFVCRGNDKTRQLWLNVKKRMTQIKGDDQDSLNHFLLNTNTGLRWGYFPIEFYHHGIVNPKTWNPGDDVYVPDNIVLHHACYTIGIDNKIKLLEKVKGIVVDRGIRS